MQLFWIICGLVFLIDRITKWIVLKCPLEKIQIFPFLDIVKVWNKGITFGILSQIGDLGNKILIFVTAGILLILYFWAKKICSQKKPDKYFLIILGMLFGGGAGNLADRILFGGVFDFINFHINSFHWPAFNIADIFITFSLLLLFYKMLKS